MEGLVDLVSRNGGNKYIIREESQRKYHCRRGILSQSSNQCIENTIVLTKVVLDVISHLRTDDGNVDCDKLRIHNTKETSY